MAKQRFGINDGYRGSVGTVIGYQWRGRWCLRSRPRRVANPRTEAQQEHRKLFRDMVRLASRMLPALRKGLRAAAHEAHVTEGNLFVKMNKGCFTQDTLLSQPQAATHKGSARNATGIPLPNLGEQRMMVDWENLIISTGPVAPVEFTVVELDDQGVLHARFEKNPLHLRASGDDEVRLYAFCPSLGQGCLSAAVYRRSKRVDMALPDQWAGREVHFYGFVTDYEQRASETVYVSLSEESGVTEEGLDLVEGEGAVDGVVAHAFAAQGAEESTAAEGFT